jgi:hypothetical protein
LLPIDRANQVGAETVNGVATNHYHFDQNGLSSGGEGTSGEMWIAQEGGYVVKYTLSLPMPAQTTGQGVETSETLSYELKGINSIDQIKLPAICVPVLENVPTMTDAQDLARGSGMLHYTSQAGIAEAIDFYNQALPSQGWTPDAPSLPPAPANSQTVEYTQGDQRLSLFLEQGGGSLDIIVVLSSSSQAPFQPTETPAAGSTPEMKPTADASQSGLPADVPLYPGATDLIKLPDFGVSFSTSDPPNAVAEYYLDQLKALQWELQNETKPATDTVLQTWGMSNRILVVNIGIKNGATTVMLMFGNRP